MSCQTARALDVPALVLSWPKLLCKAGSSETNDQTLSYDPAASFSCIVFCANL